MLTPEYFLTNNQLTMMTYSVSNPTPSGSFVLQRKGQTGPDREQEAKCLEYPTQEPCALRVNTGLTSA